MEQLFEFLFRSSISISLLYVVYWLLLRQSTHFRANRIFLLASLLLSILVAAFPLRYQIFIDTPEKLNFLDLGDAFKNTNPAETLDMPGKVGFSWQLVIPVIYLSGIAVFALRLIGQTWKLFRIIFREKPKKTENYLIHENNKYALPFSFFNHIFINPNYHKQGELTDILAHEQVHIRERHWIDLLLIELSTVIFWFNPFIWLVERAIKQNHEYLADEGVLTRGHSPVRYQALLVNQLMGMQVIGLTNNLNFALGPTRLKMMTKQKTPKLKLIRMAWGIPVVAILLVAFAKPDYQVKPDEVSPPNLTSQSSSTEKIKLTGTVLTKEEEPLPGTSIIIQGTTHGAVTDRNGRFKLEVPKNREISLVASFVGYKTIVNEINISNDETNFDYKFVMEKAVIEISTEFSEEMPPPPPPPTEVTDNLDSDEEVFFIVEEMPKYPNGHYGLGQYVKKKQKELKEKLFFEGKKLEGKATVGFTVNEKGEVTNIQVLDKTTDIAAKTLTTIVSGMENWHPGSQRGKLVPVNYAIELEF